MLFFKKFIGWLISLAVLLGLTILGLQTFLTWQNNRINQTRLEIEHSGSLEERKQKQKEKDERERKLQEAELDRLAGPNWRDKGKILDITKMKPPLGIKGLPTQSKGELVYSEEIKKHFTAILEDIDDLVNNGQVYTHKDEYRDDSSGNFTRRNTILYGMAGTGKTEFPKQLVFEIANKFQSQNEKRLNEYNQDLINKQEQLVNDSENEQLKTEIEELKELIKDCEEQLTKEESKIAPVFQIDGFHLQTAGKALNDKGLESHEKLIAILKELKKEAFGDAYSDKAYIVFVEEADQGVNVMTAGGGGKKNNLLEDWKNFLSTTEDMAGLKNNVQDPNSCIMIATNNYENLDPALVRRGRLGKKLNFSWTPELLKEYGDAGGSDGRDWAKINWPNDPAWDFNNSRYREELYKMSTKFGFAMFKDKFAPHANKIIQSWQNLDDNKRKKKEAELGTFKDENDKEICNWLLHYLFTFHQYNSKQNLDALKSAEQIQRYDFGKAARMEENTAAIASLISKSVMNLGQGIADKLSEIRGEMVANFQEISNLRTEINNFRTNITALDKDIESLRSRFSDLSSSVSSNQSYTSQLSSQISSLQSQISVLGSSSSSSSGVNSVSDYNSVVSKSNRRNEIVSSFVRIINSSNTSDLAKIVQDFINEWNNA
ncbi:MAG: Chromosome partition protein Smc [Mycoplasmataceae bacterium]|nr:MAG: Chromosome partition protein Smc [Mycoplasmataceae bacterium]